MPWEPGWPPDPQLVALLRDAVGQSAGWELTQRILPVKAALPSARVCEVT
jgi:hypothetical protein